MRCARTREHPEQPRVPPRVTACQWLVRPSHTGSACGTYQQIYTAAHLEPKPRGLSRLHWPLKLSNNNSISLVAQDSEPEPALRVRLPVGQPPQGLSGMKGWHPTVPLTVAAASSSARRGGRHPPPLLCGESVSWRLTRPSAGLPRDSSDD